MRILRCPKCGAAITSEETYTQNMIDALEEVERKAERAARNRNHYMVNVYQSKAAWLRKLIKGVIHLSAQKNEHAKIVENEKAVLVYYLLNNNLVPMEKIHELEVLARERAKKSAERDQKELERIYGEFRSYVIGKGDRDQVFKEFSKEER